MASAPDSQTVRQIDWLAHEWAFEIQEGEVLGKPSFKLTAGGQTVHSFGSRDGAERWIATRRHACLAELIAANRQLHPALVTIIGKDMRRLGRIRPELWGSYDGLVLLATAHRLSILSAKARAAFPEEPAALVMVTRDDAARRR